MSGYEMIIEVYDIFTLIGIGVKVCGTDSSRCVQQ